MNVALLHYSVPPVVGGVESVIAHHARLMNAHGHSVRLVAARGNSMGQAIPLIPIPLADSQHPRVLEVKALLDRGQVTEEFHTLRDELRSLLLEPLSQSDILIAHNVCSLNKNLPLTAALHEMHAAGELSRLILWHHDLAWTTPRYLEELHQGYPWDLLRTDWGGLMHVVVSELRRQELADLMKLDPATVKVTPNGVDPERFYKLEPQSLDLLNRTDLMNAAPILLLPVRLTPRKNIELALRTLAELRRQFPRAALLVTGPLGPHNASNREYFNSLLKICAQLGLTDSAYCLAQLAESFLPDEVIADFYRIADALILPSREEGFGIPLLEAALSHLPVFCSDIPSLRELGLENVTYFSPDENPASLAEMIAGYFHSSARARLSLHARLNYRWEAVYREHIEPMLAKG